MTGDYYERRLDLVRSSGLKVLANKSPAHYRQWVEDGGSDSTALRFGRAFHCAVLEPRRFGETYATLPDFGDMRSSTNREKRDAWLAANPGLSVVSRSDMDTIEAMARSVVSHPAVVELLAPGGVAEQALDWTDSRTGLHCRCKPDWITRDRSTVVDLKTAQDASADGFARACARYLYHVQQAHYIRGARANGYNAARFVFVVVEKTPPYAAAVYRLDEESEALGIMVRDELMDTIAACIRDDHWPGYGDGVQSLSLPRWAFWDDSDDGDEWTTKEV